MELSSAQQRKDIDRQKLLLELSEGMTLWCSLGSWENSWISAKCKRIIIKEKLFYKVEKDSNETIQELLEMSSVQRNTDALLEELEKERQVKRLH